jgi:molecular chaperone DnaK
MADKSHVVGIDLGTTYSALALVNELGKPELVLNDAGSPTTPSVVLFEDSGITIGQTAKDFVVALPDQVVECIKRWMGRSDYPGFFFEGRRWNPEEISALILKKLKQDAEQRLGFPVVDAVITVPAYFDDPRRRATEHAGEIAGLKVKRIINEPTAAAVAFGILKPDHRNQTVLVYDFGGGTFDVTILRVLDGSESAQGIARDGIMLDVIATGGDHELGGRDIDELLVQHFAREFQQAHAINPLEEGSEIRQGLYTMAEKAKRHLADRDSTKVVVSAGGKTLRTELTLKTLDDLIFPKLELTRALVQQCLNEAGLSPQQSDTILLVGGSTRLRAVRQLVRDMFGKEPDTSINPDEAVALGAGIVATMFDTASANPLIRGIANRIDISDVTSIGLGIESHVSGPDSPLRNTILLPKNTKIPAQKSGSFSTIVDGQTSVRFPVLIGDDEDPEYCTRLGEALIEGLPSNRPAGRPLEASLSYNLDGIVELTARELGM